MWDLLLWLALIGLAMGLHLLGKLFDPRDRR